MQIKIDTKEKFTVITLKEATIADNMAAELVQFCFPYLEKEIKNVVLKLDDVNAIDNVTAETIATIQQAFYEGNASFVICGLQPTVSAVFEELALDEYINQTPTESEAWDIIQMEEIERELLDNDDMDFDKMD